MSRYSNFTKKILIVNMLAFGLLVFPSIAVAAGYQLLTPLATPDEIQYDTTGFADYAQSAFKIIVGLAGLVAVTILIIGGIEYVSSGFSGNESARSSAHKRIWDAITGLVLALGGYLILQTINPKLVKFELEIKPIKAPAEKNIAAGTNAPVDTGRTDLAGNRVTTDSDTLALAQVDKNLSTINQDPDEVPGIVKQKLAMLEKNYGPNNFKIIKVVDTPGTFYGSWKFSFEPSAEFIDAIGLMAGESKTIDGVGKFTHNPDAARSPGLKDLTFIFEPQAK